MDAAEARLRDWAWSLGRTDVLLDLDALAAARAFLTGPTPQSAAAVLATMPVGSLGADAVDQLHHLAAGRDPGGHAAADAALDAWAAVLGVRLERHAAARAADQRPAPSSTLPPIPTHNDERTTR